MQRDGGPGGAGGAGNPTGGSFTGPANALDIYGDFAAAYTGSIEATQSPTEVINFTSGNFLFVGRLFFSGYFKPTTPQNGGQGTAIIQFNESTIAILKNDGETEASPTFSWVDIIIPAYTKVTVNIESNSADTDFLASVSITGRIYRG